jgi:prephenate dehydrogenase
MLIDKLAIIGVGLIGGSLARALKLAGECGTVSGFGRNRENLDKAVELGVIDSYSGDPGSVVDEADVIVLATPLSTFHSLLTGVSGHLKQGAVITDVGSTKGSVVRDAVSALGDNAGRFVPAHPIAGTEKSGVEASFPDLFKDHLVILTPIPGNSDEDIGTITRMWEICGARVVTMSVQHHDRVLSATSHLPHVLAYAMVDCLANMEEQEDIFRFSAGGFRDFTRIASSSAEMWSDICISNQENLLHVIDRYKDHLEEIERLIRAQDSQGLRQLFSRIKSIRDRAVQVSPAEGEEGK